MATQKVPLTRIDETGASEGKVLKYSSGALAWGTDNNTGSSGGGSGFAAKNQILSTETEEISSRTQYQVFGGVEILSGGTITISASGDLVLDGPDDPNKAAGLTNSNSLIYTSDTQTDVAIGQASLIHADDKLSVIGNTTVAGNVSARDNVYGSNIYGNARTLTNPGQVLSVHSRSSQDTTSFSADSWVTWDADLAITITPQSSSSKFYITCSAIVGNSSQRVFLRFLRDSTAIGIGATSSARTPCNIGSYMGGGANFDGVAGSYLDAPATASAITYQLQAYSNSGTGYLNRSSEDGDSDGSPRGMTTFTVMEIAG